MKKKLKTIFTCVGLLTISLILILVFVFVNNGNIKPLYCSAKDIEICVGETIYDFYEVSQKDAVITIEVNKEDIIDIDDMCIYAKQAGEVEVTLTAKHENETCVAVFTVKVYNPNYSIKFFSLSNCEVEGNAIYASENIFQFRFEVFDVFEDSVLNLKYEISIDGNAEISKNFYSIMIKTQQNCILSIYFSEIDFTTNINIIVD